MIEEIRPKCSGGLLSGKRGRPLGSKSGYTMSEDAKLVRSKAGFVSQLKNSWEDGSSSVVMKRFERGRLGVIDGLIPEGEKREVSSFVRDIYIKNLVSTNEPIALLMDEFAELKTKSQLVEIRDNNLGKVSKEYFELKRLTIDLAKALSKIKYGERKVVETFLLSEKGDDEFFDVGGKE